MNRYAIRRARTARVVRGTLVLTMLALMFLIVPMTVGSTGQEMENLPTVEMPPKQTKPSKPAHGFVTLEQVVTYDEAEQEDAEPVVIVPEEVEPEKLYSEDDVIALAKMAWGEALVTNSDTEMSATMWCVLNRFGSDDPYYRNCTTIASIVKQSGAFTGYSSRNPATEHLLRLAQDVLDRWNAEQHGETEVGRTLPEDYLFFHGDGLRNHFRKGFEHDGNYWDWSLESPYET